MTLPFPHIILEHFYIHPIFRQKRCASCRNRYRNRNVRNRRRLNNARDENRYRSRGSNNDNRNRDQPSRQGFGFENNFWTDGDANDFFRFVFFCIQTVSPFSMEEFYGGKISRARGYNGYVLIKEILCLKRPCFSQNIILRPLRVCLKSRVSLH